MRVPEFVNNPVTCEISMNGSCKVTDHLREESLKDGADGKCAVMKRNSLIKLYRERTHEPFRVCRLRNRGEYP